MKCFIQNRKIKIAVAGCGKISQNHLQAIKSHADDLELVAVSDVHLPTLQRVAEEFNVAACSSLEELMNTDVDIVTLCTPSGLHAQQTCVQCQMRVPAPICAPSSIIAVE
jgi:UDP-N-acetyl-2-amino-2-deoxyglucuronate dehydrogenase